MQPEQRVWTVLHGVPRECRVERPVNFGPDGAAGLWWLVLQPEPLSSQTHRVARRREQVFESAEQCELDVALEALGQ